MAPHILDPLPTPASGLGRYRLLSTHAGVHVSPIQLGAMSIGDQWEDIGFGSMSKEASFKMLDAYYDNGGNFIDTANNYQDESSEKFIGEWAERRGIRDELFIATKYTLNYKRRDDGVTQKILHTGNSAKSLHISVEHSLNKLRTNYIDLLYVHMWQFTSSVEEVMNSLHNLVVQGKVLYLGISDSPAWLVTKANQYARDHGKTPFCIYQGAWNLMERSFERDIIPMAREEGMALAPWNVLAGGKFRTDAEEKQRRETGENGRIVYGLERTEDEKKVSAALEKVAGEVEATNIRSVAIAYALQKTPFVFPIIGGRKVEHLLSNLEAIDLALTKEHIAYLESVLPFDLGFPTNMIGNGTDYTPFLTSAGHVQKLPLRQPIRPMVQ